MGLLTVVANGQSLTVAIKTPANVDAVTYSDAGRTSAISLPLDITADQDFHFPDGTNVVTVTVTTSAGLQILNQTVEVNDPDHEVLTPLPSAAQEAATGPAPTGGSVPSNLWMISDIVGTIVVTTTAQPFVFGDPPNYGGGDSADQASGAFSYNVDQTGFTTTKTGLVQLYTPISYTWAGATPGTTCVLRVQATLDLPDGGNLTFLANFISYEVDVPLTAPLSGAEAGTALSPAWPPVWLPEGTGIGPVAVKFLGGADAPSGTFTITGNNTALCAVMVTSV